MLLKDEQYIIKWLSQYGPLPKAQVIRLLRDKTPETAEKIIRSLKRQMRITDVGGYYLALVIMESDSIAQNIWNLPRNGPALKILMDLLMNMSWI